MLLLLSFVLLSFLTAQSQACGAGGGGSGDGNDSLNVGDFFKFPLVGGAVDGALVLKFINKIISETFRGTLKVDQYTGSPQGDVACPSDLDCTFDQPCRWRNVDKDKWDYLKATGQPAKEGNWSLYMGTPVTPDDPFLMAVSNSNPEANVYLASDPIPEQPGSGTVTMKLWKTPLVVVRVCTRDVNGPVVESKCQKPKSIDTDTRLATFDVPGPIRKKFELVILTDSFKLDQGGMAAIDEIKYRSVLCDEGTTTQSTSTQTAVGATRRTQPSSTSRSGCDVACNFESGSCGYSQSEGNFAVYRGSVGNRLTGIHYEKDGTPIRDTYLLARNDGGTQSRHVVRTRPSQLSKSQQYLTFDNYMATNGAKLKVCLDNRSNCVQTFADVQRRWVERRVRIPQQGEGKETRLMFVVEDLPRNGFVAIDNIQLVDASGTSLC